VVGGITLGPPAGYGAQPRRVRGQRQLTVSGSWDQALGHLGRGGNAALGEQEGHLMRVAADPAVVSRLAYPGHDRAVRATDVSRAGHGRVKNLRTGPVGAVIPAVTPPILALVICHFRNSIGCCRSCYRVRADALDAEGVPGP
jgi:hypothetical protein